MTGKKGGSAKTGFDLDRLDLSHLSDILEKEKDPETSSADPGATILESIFKAAGEIESFLSFSRQLEEINTILSIDYASTREIADVLLKDFALTSKLLKLANSPLYFQFTHKGVTTISEAMIILGTDQIQHTAANLLFFEFMKGLSRNRDLMEKTLTSFMRGIVARETASRSGLDHYEEFQICAMLYDFGEYILLFLFPGKHREIELYMERHALDREEASRRVLGMSYSRIGRAVAHKWGIPSKIVATLKPVTYVPRTLDVIPDTDMKRYVSSFAYDICSLSWHLDGDSHADALRRIVFRYSNCLNLSPRDARGILDYARDSLIRHAGILGIDISGTCFAG